MKIINLEGDVGFEITADGLRSQLPKDGKEDVMLDIYSFGGSVFEGIALYNVIKDYPGNITARIGSIGASAASFFPLSANKVTARSNSTMMIHKGWMLAVGNADDMSKSAEILNGLDSLIAGIYSKKTGKDKEQILKDMSDETWLIGWEAITDYGLVDEIDEADDPVIDKPEAMAKIEGIKSKMRTSEMFKSDIERAAAWLPKADKKPKEKVKAIVDSKDKINMEGNMDLFQFLESNPEAKAEHETLISQAKSDGSKAEAERRDKIHALSGTVISPEAKEALEKSFTPEAYAMSFMEAQAAHKAKPNSDSVKVPKATNAQEEVESTLEDSKTKAISFWDKAYKGDK